MEGNAASSVCAPAEAPKKQTIRQVWLERKNGDHLGNLFEVPKGDFSHFLGYRAQNADEKSGKQKMDGERVIEVALKKEFQKVGSGAAQRGMAYFNLYTTNNKYTNKPGRERDLVRDNLHAVREAVELNKASNLHYLEMQYKFQWAAVSYGTISNLMRVRHESTKKAISEIR